MQVRFSDHARSRIKERRISVASVILTIKESEITKTSYRNRKLFRRSFRGKILEVVAIFENGLYTVVTAYYLEED